MRSQSSGTALKIKHFQYSTVQPTMSHLFKNNNKERNPIRIVIDKMGIDGRIQRQIVEQSRYFEKQAQQISQSRMNRDVKVKSNTIETHHQYHSSGELKTNGESRSFVFNRFQYDNCNPFSIDKARSSFKRKPLSKSNNKNIQIVFCQTKLPDFVKKTNQKIQDIYLKEQSNQHDNHNVIRNNVFQSNQKINAVKKTHKITLANSLKEYGTLQKLSIFMENDQNMRAKCLAHGFDKDPSRTVLLDIITHRFSFMKNLSKRTRQNIYRSLFGRDDLNSMTKINIHQFMKFTQMFVGRESNANEVAVFMYIYLFGNNIPTMTQAKQAIQQLNGPISKQRAALNQIEIILSENETGSIETFINSERLLRLFIDLIVEN